MSPSLSFFLTMKACCRDIINIQCLDSAAEEHSARGDITSLRIVEFKQHSQLPIISLSRLVSCAALKLTLMYQQPKVSLMEVPLNYYRDPLELTVQSETHTHCSKSEIAFSPRRRVQEHIFTCKNIHGTEAWIRTATLSFIPPSGLYIQSSIHLPL